MDDEEFADWKAATQKLVPPVSRDEAEAMEDLLNASPYRDFTLSDVVEAYRMGRLTASSDPRSRQR